MPFGLMPLTCSMGCMVSRLAQWALCGPGIGDDKQGVQRESANMRLTLCVNLTQSRLSQLSTARDWNKSSRTLSEPQPQMAASRRELHVPGPWLSSCRALFRGGGLSVLRWRLFGAISHGMRVRTSGRERISVVVLAALAAAG